MRCDGCGRRWRKHTLWSPVLRDEIWQAIARAGREICLTCVKERIRKRFGRDLAFDDLVVCDFTLSVNGGSTFDKLAPPGRHEEIQHRLDLTAERHEQIYELLDDAPEIQDQIDQLLFALPDETPDPPPETRNRINQLLHALPELRDQINQLLDNSIHAKAHAHLH